MRTLGRNIFRISQFSIRAKRNSEKNLLCKHFAAIFKNEYPKKQIKELTSFARHFCSKSTNSSLDSKSGTDSPNGSYEADPPANIIPIALLSDSQSSQKIVLIPLNFSSVAGSENDPLPRTLRALSYIQENYKQIEELAEVAKLPGQLRDDHETLAEDQEDIKDGKDTHYMTVPENQVEELEEVLPHETLETLEEPNEADTSAINFSPIEKPKSLYETYFPGTLRPVQEYEELENPYSEYPEHVEEEVQVEILTNETNEPYIGQSEGMVETLNTELIPPLPDHVPMEESEQIVDLELPQYIEQNIKSVPISSMKLEFEMEMPNVKDVLINHDESKEQIRDDILNKTLQNAAIHLTTSVVMDPHIKRTVPINFNALIKGTVDINRVNFTPEKLATLGAPEFNDFVTNIAANICSVALQRSFDGKFGLDQPSGSRTKSGDSKKKDSKNAPTCAGGARTESKTDACNPKTTPKIRCARKKEIEGKAKTESIGDGKTLMDCKVYMRAVEAVKKKKAEAVSKSKAGSADCKVCGGKTKAKKGKECEDGEDGEPTCPKPCMPPKCPQTEPPKTKPVLPEPGPEPKKTPTPCIPPPCPAKQRPDPPCPNTKPKAICGKEKKSDVKKSSSSCSGSKLKDKICGAKKTETKSVCGEKKADKKTVCGEKKTEKKAVCGEKKAEKKSVCGEKKTEKKAVCGEKKAEKKSPCGEKKAEKKSICSAKKPPVCGENKAEKKQQDCPEKKSVCGEKKTVKKPLACGEKKADKKPTCGQKKPSPCAAKSEKKTDAEKKKTSICASSNAPGCPGVWIAPTKPNCPKKEEKKAPCGEKKKPVCGEKKKPVCGEKKADKKPVCGEKKTPAPCAAQKKSTCPEKKASKPSVCTPKIPVKKPLPKKSECPPKTGVKTCGSKINQVKPLSPKSDCHAKKSKPDVKKCASKSDSKTKCGASPSKESVKPKCKKEQAKRSCGQKKKPDGTENEIPMALKIKNSPRNTIKHSSARARHFRQLLQAPIGCGSHFNCIPDIYMDRFNMMTRRMSRNGEGPDEEFNEMIRISDLSQVCIDRCPMPRIGDYDVLVRVNSVGLSGSDLYMFETGGKLCPPISLGHEASGVVERIGKCVLKFHVGDHVAIEPGIPCGICHHCLAGAYNICQQMVFNGLLGKFCVHPEDFCHKLSQDVNLEEGALVHILATACNACSRAQLKPSTSLLIIGGCPLGIATLFCARSMGVPNICLVCSMKKNLQLARDLGADSTVWVDEKMTQKDILEEICYATKKWPDAAINCSVCTNSLNVAVTALKPSGTCVVTGCDSECAYLNILEALMKEIRIVPSFRSCNMFPLAINLFESDRAPLCHLITHRFGFDEAQEAFCTALKEKETCAIRVLVKCQEVTVEKLKTDGT